MFWSEKHQLLVARLRKKYGNDSSLHSALDNILWYSVPLLYSNFKQDFREICKKWAKTHQRRRRIRKYVNEMALTFPRLMLCTLTFNDVLMTTSEDSRKQYVSRYLNSVCADYFACIDFGGKLGREHYHAIIAADYPMQFVGKHKRRDCYDFKDESKRWSNGWSNFTYIDTDGANVYKVLGYAMKSVNYAFKAADSGYKPFHKRGVYHCKTAEDWSVITDDAFL